MNIRAATMQDLDQIIVLSKEILEFHDKLLPNYFSPNNDEARNTRTANLITYPDAIFLVATDDEDKVVGYIIAQIIDTPRYVRHIRCDINELGITASARKMGAGRALIETLKAECSRRGVQEMHLSVYLNNKNAVAFYEKMGFAPDSQRMVMDL
jgi:ribosomal protein S18 acetylase RimI-like enzyme